MSTIFESLQQNRETPVKLLDDLIAHLREQRRAAELFEAIKMRTRLRLGLPVLAVDDEPNRPDDVERQLESGLLDACREAGKMLIEDGQAGQGWMYLRPTGDVESAREWISEIEVNDDNYDEMLQVLLHEGVDIRRGFRLMLDHQGTCNSITTYQQNIVSRSLEDRRAAAETLLDHFYDELTQAVRDDIARREAPAAEGETLGEMIESRPQILAEGGYHLDTTHIASVVQIASLVNDQPRLQKALELCQYGRRLHHQFQYPGEEPFKDFYPAYTALYNALLGNHVEAGLEYFRRKAETLDPNQHGTNAIETYVDLLERTGHPLRAIKVATDLVPEGVPPQRMLPILGKLATQVSSAEHNEAIEAIADYCRRRGDLLGYAAVLAMSPAS